MSKNKCLYLILTAACLLLGGCALNEQEADLIDDVLILPNEVNYNTVQAEYGEYVKEGRGTGSLIFPVYDNLYCENQGARMKECHVMRGDIVSAGDTLVTFDLEEYATELKELELELERIKESYSTNSQSMLREIETAGNQAEGTGGQDSTLANLRIEKLRLEYEQYKYETNRQINQLKEQMEELKGMSQKDTLTAPFDGVIESLTFYQEGDLIDLTKPVLTISSQDMFYIKTDTAESLRYNMPVTVKAGARNNPMSLEGVVISAPNILPDSVNQDYAVIRVPSETSIPMLSRSISYICETEKLQNILLIDSKAVQEEIGKSYVYVLEDNAVKKRYVTAGLSSLGKTWILDGLTEEQTVILNY